MNMPTPTAMDRKLEKLVGAWRGDEHLHPSPWDPHGGPATGRVQNRVALDGFAVVQEYEQERNGHVNYRAHGIFRWEPAEHNYQLYWFDSMGSPPTVFRGAFEAEVLTLTSRQGSGFVRAIWDFSKAGQYSYAMEVSGDGEQWQPFADGVYSRVS